MVFSSYLFIFYFLPVVLLAYYLAPRAAKLFVLAFVSYAFYGWSNPAFVVLLLFSTMVDYCCGLVIVGITPWGREPESLLDTAGLRSGRQRLALVLSLLSNLSLLGFFKYFNFVTDSWDGMIQLLGIDGWAFDFAIQVTLPLGISFYTFQSMSYTIDVYRGHARPLKNFMSFACYVSMFPQLVAGPIVRYADVAEQLRSRTHTLTKFARGVAFICLGLTKKVWLANPAGKIADVAFSADSLTVLDAWYGVVAYAFQIYFDFSAYSDMAIGLGLMLGFVFPKNFNSPYLALSITDFWRRWHISLSSWLRDYLYIPLGGNRKGEMRTYLNLLTVMLLGGLWHGASWNFIVWGGLHGIFLMMERIVGKMSVYRALPHVVQVVVTFFLLLVTWVFFRGENLSASIQYLLCMAGVAEQSPGALLVAGVIYQPFYICMMIVSAGVVWGGQQTWDWTRVLSPQKLLICIFLFVASVMMLTAQAYNPFIYFIF